MSESGVFKKPTAKQVAQSLKRSAPAKQSAQVEPVQVRHVDAQLPDQPRRQDALGRAAARPESGESRAPEGVSPGVGSALMRVYSLAVDVTLSFSGNGGMLQPIRSPKRFPQI